MRKRGEAKQLYLESLVDTLTGWNDPEARLRKAIEDDEFMLFGQTIVPLDRKKEIRFHLEILIRLREEERNLTPPGTFLPILEYFELMPALDRWVIEHAARWWKSTERMRNTVLNINLSPDTLESADFPEFVAARLSEIGLPAGVLCFEVTGSEVPVGSAEVARSIEKVKALGCRFAVSAFGRESISFDALRMVGAKFVKIDGGMIREIHSDTVAFTKVKSIHQVCAKAGIQTVAEFVELPETLNRLREIGVDYAQGYGISRPEPLEAQEGSQQVKK